MDSAQIPASFVRGSRYQPRRGRGRRGRNRGRQGGEWNARTAGAVRRSASAVVNTMSFNEEYAQELRDRNRTRFSSVGERTREPSCLQTEVRVPSSSNDDRMKFLDSGNALEHFIHDHNEVCSTGNPEALKIPSRSAIPLDLVVSKIDTAERKIGIGHATGVSRVPEKGLSDSPELVWYNLKRLGERVQGLLRQKHTVLEADGTNVPTAATEQNFADWEAIHGSFRQLTMSITASTKPEMKQLAIPVYESAADASLYGGNLSFFLSCQTRLLKELYGELSVEQRKNSRYSEFIGYSVLYFGVFHVDDIEITQLMRSMDRHARKDSSVQLAFSMVLSFRNRDGRRIFELYRRCNVRQRVIVFPALESIRRQMLSVLIRAYMQLSKFKTVSILGMKSESDAFALLAKERPDLAARVNDESDAFSFRVSL